ncbi:MAG: NAD-dependent epimerase/dehydratase family protein [Azoarcus sp.]|jgi:nucleoside-diphosphate-sugar epimerase|nr:NAD-dependent epimerase/dehydratase family protein [Azoarcus sp.]
MSAVLLTGGSGFIGQALAARLAAQGHRLRLALRSPPQQALPGEVFRFAGLNGDTDWSAALAGIEGVIHCAGRAHVMKESAADPLDVFRRCNVDGSLRLARQAARAGVRRFVFVSTAKVWGGRTLPGQPFTVDSAPDPDDAYARSKLEAERALRALAADGSMEVVIVRPPLVYGPGVKANFLRLMQWLDRGWPLPLAAAHNQRSLIARDNLVDLLARCLDHPAAANQVLPVSDGEDLPVAELLRRLGNALGKPARLFHVPIRLLRIGATLFGQQAMADRLCAPLQVDDGHTRRLLGWSPPLTVDEALARTAADFRAHSHH